jgi:hypothetical protein
MKKLNLLFVITILCGLLMFNSSSVSAFPPLPASFYGTVKIDGENVPEGTLVSAWINGVEILSVVVEEYGENTVYSINVPGDDSSTEGEVEGGIVGDVIVFYIGDLMADQTAIWSSSNNVLNLTTSAFKTERDIVLSNNTVEENQEVGTLVGSFITENEDPELVFSYTLVSGAGDDDNASFEIDGVNLITAEEFDSTIKDTYSIRVRSEDQDGFYSEKVFSIIIIDAGKDEYFMYLPLFIKR